MRAKFRFQFRLLLRGLRDVIQDCFGVHETLDIAHQAIVLGTRLFIGQQDRGTVRNNCARSMHCSSKQTMAGCLAGTISVPKPKGSGKSNGCLCPNLVKKFVGFGAVSVPELQSSYSLFAGMMHVTLQSNQYWFGPFVLFPHLYPNYRKNYFAMFRILKLKLQRADFWTWLYILFHVLKRKTQM